MKLILLPFKEGSEGAQRIAETLNVRRVLRGDVDYRPDEPTVAINWGRGDYPRWRNRVQGFINHPCSVANAIDKKTAFLMMKEAGVPVPEFTTDINVARGWLDRRETIAVFCRTEVDAARGNGIVVARRAAELVPAPLYTKYVRKVHEYRIHAMKGEVFYVNKKQRRLDAPRGEQLVRSGREGWFFVHLDLPQWPNANARNAAGQAVAALGLDFGGVDVGVSEDGTATVYEVNTAPEIGRNTAAAYKAAFQQHYGQYNNNENVPIRNL